MILKFTNKQIYFTLESIWPRLDYKFKYHINELVTNNSEEDFEQTVTVSLDVLMECYRAMSSGAYGCTTDMADVLLVSLRNQLLEVANITEYMTYLEELAVYNEAKAEWDAAKAADPEFSDPEPQVPIEVIPNEEASALLAISKYKEQDKYIENAKILNGKTQILK